MTALIILAFDSQGEYNIREEGQRKQCMDGSN
jgi:hypothetical protein